jgi:hypothetical protein
LARPPIQNCDKMKKRNPYIGKWRITEMEMWDKDFIDMETEGHFLFEKDDLGSFQFGLVQGQIDYRIEKIDEVERLEFTWEGQDENDEALGRGWAILGNDYLEGRFYFHLGDDSWFKAKKYK